MKLKKFMQKNKITITEMAYLTGSSFYKIYHAVLNKTPKLETACLIEHFTEGEVKATDLLPIEVVEKIKKTKTYKYSEED